MTFTRLVSSLLVSSLLVVPACGGDDGSSSSNGSDGTEGTGGTTDGTTATATASATATTGTASNSGTDSSTDPTPGTSATDTTSGTGGTSTSTTTDSGGTTDSSGGTAGACSSWVVTYDLKGSKMIIDALVDFEITVEEPYTDDNKMGPGTMKIRFTDDGGKLGNGTAHIIDYQLDQNFVTGSFGTDVTTDLETWSGPEACGTATGTFDGSAITWNPTELDPLCQDGTVSCSGSFCGMSGAPPENMPIVFNMDCSGTMTLNDFVFTNGTDNFTMAASVLSMENGQTTSMEFVGTATATEEDASTPACACG